MDRARGQTDNTISELRRLTRGIHPVALDGGLDQALPDLTATWPVPVTVHLDLCERPHQVIERAIYFCAAELLTNVAKHSGARSAELTAYAADGRVRLSVQDELGEDSGYMLLQRPFRHHQQRRDGTVGVPLCHQLQHLTLARRQGVHPAALPAPQQPGDHLRVEHRASGGDLVQRVRELRGASDAFRQQVSDTCGAVCQQPGGQGGLDVLGEDQDAGLGCRGPDLDGGADALVRVRGRHPDVHHGHVRPVPGHRGEQFRRRPGGGHHLAAAGTEQLDHAVTEHDGILGQYHAQSPVDHDAIICPATGRRRTGNRREVGGGAAGLLAVDSGQGVHLVYGRSMTSDDAVADEAIGAAWDSYRVLEPRTSAEDRQEAQRRVQAATETYGRAEMARGTVFLVGVLTGYLIAEQSGADDRLDPLSDLIPAVIRRLPTFELADPAQVPMATGVLMAAAMGMDTVAWRDRFGRIAPEEALVHGFVLWLLADLFDSLIGRPGVIDQLMRKTLAAMAGGHG